MPLHICDELEEIIGEQRVLGRSRWEFIKKIYEHQILCHIVNFTNFHYGEIESESFIRCKEKFYYHKTYSAWLLVLAAVSA